MRAALGLVLGAVACLGLDACKLPYRTRPQVLVVPYRNLVPDLAGGAAAGAPTCLRAPLTDLPAPPEALQFQVKTAFLKLELRNEGSARLHAYPYLAERGADAYGGPGLSPDAPLELTTRGATQERTFPLVPALFRSPSWSFGLRLTSPTPFEPASRATSEQVEVRWQLEVDAAVL